MEDVTHGKADYAVLPIENSTAGIVADIYDLLMEYKLYIVGEQIIRVDHVLLGMPDAQIGDIREVCSHPQGLAQCKAFLEENPSWKKKEVENTAGAATVIAFVVVILFVNLLRTRAFDYAWRIAVIAGGVIYILVILAGDFCISITVAMVPMILSTVISVLAGFVLEFFVFGGDYSRTERLEYEDDEYYYYVKAVPKATVATSERSIKKINAEPVKEEKKEDNVVSFSDDVFPEKNEMHTVKMPDMFSENTVSEKPQGLDKIDFEKQLEESLKDL